MTRSLVTTLFSLTLLSAGCSSKNPGAYQAAATTSQRASIDVDAVLEEAETLWAQRADPAALKEALGLYEQIVGANPVHRQALTRLVRGWYFLGDAHMTDKDEKIETWGVAITWGKRCLALNEEFAARVNSGEKEKDAVVATTEQDVPCLYWTASAIGKWGKAQGIAKALGNLPTVKAYIARAEELQPDFYYYGPARYWGAYYSVLPSFAGQDLEASARYFEASLDGAPEYQPTRGLRAENLAVKKQDVALFMSDLQAILDFDATSVPDLEPENTLEKAKAQALIDKRDELFGKKAIEAYEAANAN